MSLLRLRLGRHRNRSAMLEEANPFSAT